MREESERQTRKTRIDPLLRAVGWDIIPYKDGMNPAQYNKYALEEFPTDNGPADYAFCLDGKIVAVVEAKKVTLVPQNVLTQAERYSSTRSSGVSACCLSVRMPLIARLLRRASGARG